MIGMEEKYLCASCLYCFEFFDLFCSQTEEECPSGCIECEYYVEVKNDV